MQNYPARFSPAVSIIKLAKSPLNCLQHVYSVMSRAVFFVPLLYTMGFKNNLSMLHVSSLRIAQAASSLTNRSCIHV